MGRITSKIRVLGKLRVKTNHEQLILISVLSLIVLIAFCVRLLPMRWGLHLSEFDPYVQYRSAEYVVDNGFLAWFSWHDDKRWYPNGIDTYRAIFPGLPFTAAFFYKIIQALALPISLYDFAVLFPALMGALASVVMYFWGKDTWGKGVGIFSALFLGLNNSYIQRTTIGWFDDESVGIFAIILFCFFFLRSIDRKRSWNSTVKYAIASGLTLGYLFASWGAAYFPLGLMSSFAIVLLVLKRYSLRLLFSYGCTFGLSLCIAINVPRLSIYFLFRFPVLLATLVFLLLCFYEILRRIQSQRWKVLYGLGFLGLILLLLLLPFQLERHVGDALMMTGGKILAVLNPFSRATSPLVESVQEHRPPAWGTFYYSYGVGIFFILIGVYFTLKNFTDRSLFLILYAFTSLYFTSSMVRLTVILAPSFSLLWAIGLVNMVKPFFMLTKTDNSTQRNRKYSLRKVPREFGGGAIILVCLLLMPTFILPLSPISGKSRIFDQACSPVTIMSSSVPVRTNEPILEWYNTLMWMKYELPSEAVVVSWWDYGYWITVIGNKITLADNGTSNATQIGNIGRIFMSNEAESIRILETYKRGEQQPDYIVVFTTFDANGNDRGYGDEGKWRWMAKIAGLNDMSFGNLTLGFDWFDTNGNGQREAEELISNAKGHNSTLYRLMTQAKRQKISSIPDQKLEYFAEAYFSEGKNYGGTYIMVAVYKINYEGNA